MANRNSCGVLLKQINDELEKNANNAMRTHDITMAQCGLLLVLNDMPEQQLPLKELERQLHIAQSTAVGLVSRLEQKKLVEGFGSAEDKRIKIIRITQEGAECCRQAQQHMTQAEEHILSGLTDTEKAIFLALLKKVRDSL